MPLTAIVTIAAVVAYLAVGIGVTAVTYRKNPRALTILDRNDARIDNSLVALYVAGWPFVLVGAAVIGFIWLLGRAVEKLGGRRQ